MKRIFIVISLLVAACATLCAKEIKEIIFTPSPVMTCENCENRIKGNIRFEKGVKDITTNRETQEVVIKYDAEKTTPEQLSKAFCKIGYNVVEKTENCDNAKTCITEDSCDNATTGCDKGKDCCKKKITDK